MRDKHNSNKKRMFPRKFSMVHCFFIIVAIMALLVSAWITSRIDSYGITNFFSREIVYYESGELTDAVAIKYTLAALEASGRTGGGALSSKGFSRNSLDTYGGYVLWHENIDEGKCVWLVRISKRGSRIGCRVFRQK